MLVHARDSASLIFCTLFYRNFDFKITSRHPVFLCFLVLHLPHMQSAPSTPYGIPPPFGSVVRRSVPSPLVVIPPLVPRFPPGEIPPAIPFFFLLFSPFDRGTITTNIKEIAHVPVAGIGERQDLPSFNHYTVHRRWR